ncbi:hypothetical protein [Prosthecodimorpha staleyi]|uniref:Uncharacterized protein n=1 Tax=Prosthecodimorpha staleyi TaxID=2840188 RepID=A0A947D511_9HYPH|nr:hypothetical protein [Prosthecodimorpha staleyi]MBT9288262.1 hypothetical protein [Prosthecodimorpha staleyi]
MTEKKNSAQLSEGWAAHILIDQAYHDAWLIAFAHPFENWIERHGDDLYLRSVFFKSCPSARAVHPIAIVILRMMTGAMLLTQITHDARILGVVNVDGSGRRHVTLITESFHMRVAGSSIIEGGEPAARTAVKRASKNLYLEEALAYFGDQGGWFDLYKCIESIEQWAGGGHELEDMNLIPRDEFKRAKRSANNMRHARLKNKALTNEASFDEAWVIVRDLLSAALARKEKELNQ